MPCPANEQSSGGSASVRIGCGVALQHRSRLHVVEHQGSSLTPVLVGRQLGCNLGAPALRLSGDQTDGLLSYRRRISQSGSPRK